VLDAVAGGLRPVVDDVDDGVLEVLARALDLLRAAAWA
jgi:hypothetical protein